MRIIQLEPGRPPTLAAALDALNPLSKAVIVLSPSFARASPSALGTWLDRRRLRRSLLVFASSRAQAVDAGLRHGVSPTRFRVLPADRPANEVIQEEIRRLQGGARTWHSA